jgi:hypothetical protein
MNDSSLDLVPDLYHLVFLLINYSSVLGFNALLLKLYRRLKSLYDIVSFLSYFNMVSE